MSGAREKKRGGMRYRIPCIGSPSNPDEQEVIGTRETTQRGLFQHAAYWLDCTLTRPPTTKKDIPNFLAETC